MQTLLKMYDVACQELIFYFQVLLMLLTATALRLTKLYKTTNFLLGFFF